MRYPDLREISIRPYSQLLNVLQVIQEAISSMRLGSVPAHMYSSHLFKANPGSKARDSHSYQWLLILLLLSLIVGPGSPCYATCQVGSIIGLRGGDKKFTLRCMSAGVFVHPQEVCMSKSYMSSSSSVLCWSLHLRLVDCLLIL